MVKSDEELHYEFAANLRQARQAAGYPSARRAAKAMGVNVATYTSHENGQRGIEPDVAKLYASFFKIDVGKIFDVSGLTTQERADTKVAVVSEAKMGVWKSAALDIGEQKGNIASISLPPSRSADVRYAVEMGDESANRSIPAGWHGIYTALDCPIPELHNKLVFIERERHGLVERSFRRATLMPDGTLRLAADTDDRRYKGDVTYYPGTDDEVVRIVGRVIGKYLESDDI